jgi:hypothetical protein
MVTIGGVKSHTVTIAVRWCCRTVRGIVPNASDDSQQQHRGTSDAIP